MFDAAPIDPVNNDQANNGGRGSDRGDVYRPLGGPLSRQTVRAFSLPAKPSLDLVTDWRGDVSTLRDAIEEVSDWGPFELIEAAPFQHPQTKKRLIFCRFVYHGADPSREHAEKNLRELLAGISNFKNP